MADAKLTRKLSGAFVRMTQLKVKQKLIVIEGRSKFLLFPSKPLTPLNFKSQECS